MTHSPQPPRAAQRPVTLRNFSHVRVDPFFWLRERENPDVLQHLEQENAYTDALMASTAALQASLYREILSRIDEDAISSAFPSGDFIYYTRRIQGQDYALHCRRPRSGGEEDVYLNENILAQDKAYFELGLLEISPNGKLLAYAVDETGDEEFTLYFKDLTSGKTLPDVIPEVAGDGEWSADSQRFLYTTEDETRRADKIFLHQLGQPHSHDRELLHEPDIHFNLNLYSSQDNQFIFAYSESKQTTEVWFAPCDHPEIPFVSLLPRKTGVRYYAEHYQNEFLIRSNENAVDFKLLAIPVNDRKLSSAREIIPARTGIYLSEVLPLQKHWIIFEKTHGQQFIRVLKPDGSDDHLISMPDAVYYLSEGDNDEFATDILQIVYSSPIRPQITWNYNLTARQRQTIHEVKIPCGHNPEDYRTERQWATAGDGTKIPITLFYRKDSSGKPSPTYLYGYGAYGETVYPSFNPLWLTWLERGFVVAIPHVRGGGFLGETWYEAGKFLNKRNSFDDFITCTQFLIKNHYSAPHQIIAEGGSAGGLLIGGVINLRPDLFCAIHAAVPFVDIVSTMLDESLPLTTFEYEEWGNPNQEDYFNYMLSYSPYDNVSPQNYPAILATAGINDPRVPYWEAAKWVAKLRQNQKGQSPVLLKTNLEAGHGGASGRYQALREIAFEQAFLLSQAGLRY